MVVDRRELLPARVYSAADPGGSGSAGGLGVDAVGHHGQATVPNTASPVEPPTCWPVLSRLEATPESCS